MKRIMFTGIFATMSMMTMAGNVPDVEGTVVDSNGQPLEFVNVVLLNEADSTFIQGATTDGQGHFLIKTPANHGILKVTSVGYQTTFASTHSFNGRVTLADDEKMLDEVVVKGQLPKTKLTGNSLVTTVQGSVLEKSGTAQEMLAKVPGMTQKGDGLEVLGKGAPVYYINGRKMRDADELKRLRSEEIKEVEVITNPGAQYDATVSAVVRIKTIRRQDGSFGYDVNLYSINNLRYGYYNPSGTVNLHYRHKALELFGMVNGWSSHNVTNSAPHQWSYFMDKGKLTSIDQDTHFHVLWKGKGFDWNVGFNLQLAEDHTIGMRVEQHQQYTPGFTGRQQTDMVKQTVGVDASRQVTRNVAEEVTREHTPYNWEGNAYYNGKVGKLGIDLNLDFLTNESGRHSDIVQTANDVKTGITSDQKSSNQMFADKLVLSYPVWKGMLQVGTEMSFVTRKSDYAITMEELPATSSEVKENNLAGFVEYACMIPKVGSLNAGLRFEHVGFDYKDRLDSRNSMSRYTNDLFPTLSWANQWGSFQTSLSYSLKTQRPDYWMLNEAVEYINPYSFQTGDPKLKNSKTHTIGANARWKWLNLYMSYEHTDDALTQWSYIYNDEGVILIKNRNLDDPVRVASAFLTAFPTFGCYSPNWTVGFQKYNVKQTLADPREASGWREVKYSKPIPIANINNTFRLKHSWQLEANLNYIGRGDFMNFRMRKSVYNLDLVVQKCWLKNDALCLRASLGDVFQLSRQKIDMDCGYYTLHQTSYNNNHRLLVSLRYSFNATNSRYKGTGAGKEAVGRMSK